MSSETTLALSFDNSDVAEVWASKIRSAARLWHKTRRLVACAEEAMAFYRRSEAAFVAGIRCDTRKHSLLIIAFWPLLVKKRL